MRERDRVGPSSDRERREALEALQVELRELRAAVAQQRTATDTPPAVQALRDAIAQAAARREAARERHAALERERADLENEQRWHEREAKEEKRLRLGAARRNRYVDWAGARMPSRGGGGAPTSPAAAAVLFAMVGGVLLLAVFSAHCGGP